MSRKIDGNLTKSGPVPSLPLRRNHEKQSRIRGRKHMLYVVFPPRFNMFPFRFHLRNQVISSCVFSTLLLVEARGGQQVPLKDFTVQNDYFSDHFCKDFEVTSKHTYRRHIFLV